MELLVAAGEQLMGVGLVTGVPHDPIPRRAHHAMERQRDLHRSQRAGQVPAGALDGADHLLAQLRGELLELSLAQTAQPRGVGEGVEDRQGALRYGWRAKV